MDRKEPERWFPRWIWVVRIAVAILALLILLSATVHSDAVRVLSLAGTAAAFLVIFGWPIFIHFCGVVSEIFANRNQLRLPEDEYPYAIRFMVEGSELPRTVLGKTAEEVTAAFQKKWFAYRPELFRREVYPWKELPVPN